MLALGRFHEEEFWGTHWFRCCGTGILTRNPAEPWVVMSLRLNIQDFEEELQPNALLASIQCGKWRKNLEHVHGLSASSDSKAPGEGKERRQTAFRINEAERIYVALSQDSMICRDSAIMHFQAQPLQDSP